jgi:hypothetical protein
VDREFVGTIPEDPYRLQVIPQATANSERLLVKLGHEASMKTATGFDGLLDETVHVAVR